MVAIVGGFRDDTFHSDEAGVYERRKNRRGGALDVADLLGAGVEDPDGIGVVGIEGLADEADELAAADGAAVVAKTDDVDDDVAGEEEILRRRSERRGFGSRSFFIFWF